MGCGCGEKKSKTSVATKREPSVLVRSKRLISKDVTKEELLDILLESGTLLHIREAHLDDYRDIAEEDRKYFAPLSKFFVIEDTGVQSL